MQNATLHRRKYQCRRIKKYGSQCDSYSFFNLLTSDLLFEELESRLPPHRERLYPPTETLSMFLSQAMSQDRSCQNVVNRHAVRCLAGGLPVSSTHTGGYCRARQRLPLEMVQGLARFLGGHLDGRVSDEWLWNHRRVRIVDGTTITLPDTRANQAAYPQQRGQKPGLGFPICRIVGITSLENGALIDAAVGRFNGKGGDEQTLLRSLWETFSPGDIVLADAFFATYFFIADMQSKGIDLLMEQHGARRLSTDFRRGKRLGVKDHMIEIAKPKLRPAWMSEEAYAAAPASLRVREFRTKGKVMVTTMSCCKRYSKHELAELYKKRWNVELDIRHIKDTLGMNILSCKTPEMALKELWVYLLAYNLLRVLMAQSASFHDILPRQLSFKHCLQLWLWALVEIELMDERAIRGLMNIMAQQTIGKRPGRIEPRAVKRRPKAYPLLTIPREEAQQCVKKYGHPKKIK